MKSRRELLGQLAFLEEGVLQVGQQRLGPVVEELIQLRVQMLEHGRGRRVRPHKGFRVITPRATNAVYS